MGGFRGRARPRSGPSNGDRVDPGLARGIIKSTAGEWPPSEREALPGIGLCMEPVKARGGRQQAACLKGSKSTTQRCTADAKKALRRMAGAGTRSPSGRLRRVSVGCKLSEARSPSRVPAVGLDCEGCCDSTVEGSVGESRPGGRGESMTAHEVKRDGGRTKLMIWIICRGYSCLQRGLRMLGWTINTDRGR
jgi:hypothetical protein